jgi:hypothetical protein
MPINPAEVDWTDLARKIDALNRGGYEVGRGAIVELLGEPLLEAAVDFYIGYPDGFAVVQSILDVLRPDISRKRCLEIYVSDADQARKQGAVELLTTVGDQSKLPWVQKFLTDDDPVIQGLGAAVLDKLVWGERVEPAEAERYIQLAEASDNAYVVKQAARIREYLSLR